MKLISFQKLGENRQSTRLWLESRRLDTLGFGAGTAFSIRRCGQGIRLQPVSVASNHVSERASAGRRRPIIDVANRSALWPLANISEIKVTAHFGRIDVVPSMRGFHIAGALKSKPPFNTLEVFCGGGTLSAAIGQAADFELIAGVEIEPKFADVWQTAHPQAALYQADIRLIHPAEIPRHTVLIASIPCTSHSTLGRAKKSLAGKPEPAACVFENVPAFARSLACLSLVHHLKKLGYSVFETIVDPLNEWNEPQDRRRWIAVATLKPGFEIVSPLIPFNATVGQFLDAPAESDHADAERIARSIESLRRHKERHAKLGHGFGFTTIDHQSKRVPTIVRSYHKINTGPFVETAHGLIITPLQSKF